MSKHRLGFGRCYAEVQTKMKKQKETETPDRRNLYPEKLEHREREHEFMEMHMKHIGK